MPELPEVEALAAFLRARAGGRKVAGADVVAVQALKTVNPPPAALVGRAITGVHRHGKFLDLECEGLHLVAHLGRSGRLRWRDDLTGARPARSGRGPLAARVRLSPDPEGRAPGFELHEAGPRKRLALYVVHDPAEVPGIAGLGIDPLSDGFTVARLREIVRAGRTQVKGLLRDQRLISGIGDAYSDEILHAARLSPFKLADSLTDDQVAALHSAIVTVLGEAVAEARALAAERPEPHPRLRMRVHGRTGEACHACGDTIREVSFADSALQYCPTCQTGGRPLADRRLSRLLR